MSDIITRRMIGQRPPKWDRSVIFVANLRSMFFGNKGHSDWLEREIRGVGTYGGRLVPLLDLMYRGPDNLLVVEEAPNPSLLRYCREHLQLELPEIVVVGRQALSALEPGQAVFDQLARHSARWIEGFVTDTELAALSRRLGKQCTTSSESSQLGNNKLMLHRFLAGAGLPVFETEVATDPEQIPAILDRLAARGYTHAALKSPIGASGIGLAKVPCIGADLTEIPDGMFYEGEVMVQGWLDASLPEIYAIGSPSVQLFVQEEHVYLYDLTEQLLSELHLHQGNVAPPPYLEDHPGLEEELLQQAEQIATWLHGTGYRGTASIDFIVIRRGTQLEAYACEINARVTGATYPSMLARQFAPGEAWLMRNLRAHEPVAGEDLLSALELAGLLYARGKVRGVLPINFNLDEAGRVFKGQFLCIAPSTDECYQLLEETDQLETTEWSHARD